MILSTMTNSISSSAHCLTVHLQYSTHYTVSEVCYVPLKITLLYCVICNYTPKPPPNRIIFYKPKNRQKICGLAKKFTVFDDKPPEKIQLETDLRNHSYCVPCGQVWVVKLFELRFVSRVEK